MCAGERGEEGGSGVRVKGANLQVPEGGTGVDDADQVDRGARLVHSVVVPSHSLELIVIQCDRQRASRLDEVRMRAGGTRKHTAFEEPTIYTER